MTASSIYTLPAAAEQAPAATWTLYCEKALVGVC